MALLFIPTVLMGGCMQGMSRLALVILLPSTLLPQATTTEIPFPGGVTFEARFAKDTHKRVCSVATPMRGVQAVVLGGSVVNVLVNEPLRRGPTGMPRAYVGQGSSFQLNAGDRAGVMLVPESHVPGLIRALYAGDPVSVQCRALSAGGKRSCQ
jgi:hypothetical protein